MAEQFINAPAPSRAEFQTLSDHIGSLFVTETLTGITTSSGALELTTAMKNGTFICAYGLNTAYLVFRRDYTYLMVKDSITLAAVANTEVSVRVVYVK